MPAARRRPRARGDRPLPNARASRRLTVAELRDRWPRPPGCSGWAWAAATGWPATCRTCRRRWSPPGHGQPRRHLGLVRARVRRAQRVDRFGQIEPTCCSPSRLPLRRRPIDRPMRSPPSAPRCRLARPRRPVPRRRADNPRRDRLGRAASPSRAAGLRAGPVRPPALHPLRRARPGRPRPIVHGHGGILLEHLKVLGLHQDLGPGDRFFWFTTTGWMMWNYLVSGLLRRLRGRAVRRHPGRAGPRRAVAHGRRDGVTSSAPARPS